MNNLLKFTNSNNLYFIKMKFYAIAFSIFFFAFIIENIELSSSSEGNVYKDRRDSYKACIKLKTKAPYFNLKCENFLDFIKVDIDNTNISIENGETIIKTLYMDKTETRKVNKNEENKLRNLIKKLTHENKLKFN